MNTKLKMLTAALGAAALLAPVADAKRSADKPAKAKKVKAQKQAKLKNAVLRGNVVSVDAAGGKVVVAVDSASRWGRDAVGGTDETFTVASVKKIKVHDVNGDGVKDLNDFAAGDRVHVQARVDREQDWTQEVAARKLDNKTARPVEAEEAPAETESETETPPAS